MFASRRKVLLLIFYVFIASETIKAFPLARSPGGSASRHRPRPTRNQELTLFPDEMFEDSIQAYAAQTRRLVQPSARNTRQSGPKVLFPDESEASDQNHFPTANISLKRSFDGNGSPPHVAKAESLVECISSGQTFCDEYPSDYSPDLIDRIVRRDLRANSHFFTFRHTSSAGAPDPNQNHRLGAGEETFPSCASKRSTVYPKYARDIDGDWNAVINTKKYRQAIQSDSCISQPSHLDESPANKIINFGNLITKMLPADYRAKCVQRHQTYVLLTVAKGRIDKKVFKVPSHCEFEITRTRYE